MDKGEGRYLAYEVKGGLLVDDATDWVKERSQEEKACNTDGEQNALYPCRFNNFSEKGRRGGEE